MSFSSTHTRNWFSRLATGLIVAATFGACGSSDTVSVTGVTLDHSTLNLTVGGSNGALVATVAPSDATNKLVAWASSNSNVATVSQSGIVSPVAVGSAIITVTTSDGAKKATCTVTVVANAVAVTGVTLDKQTLNLTAGGASAQLTASIQPATATNKSVTWSSNHTDVVTVSSTGAVTPLAAGTATITVTTADGSKTATCTVTVGTNSVAVTGVALDKQTLSLTAGGASAQLTASIDPSTATNTNVSWASDHPDVATVSTTGVVTPLAVGTARITVTTADGAKIDTCTVTVVAATVAVTGVTLDRQTLNLTVGGAEGQLAATIQPANATNTNVSWSSDHSNVATVSSSGAVNPVAVGTATITVTTADGAKTATCTVTVVAATVAVTGVTLDKQTLTLTAGGAPGQLAATIQPANATNTNVSWSSDHNNVATVSSTGAVNPVAVGTAKITVTTDDGAKTDTCTVTVVAATVAVTGVTLDKQTLNLTAGGAEGQLTATIQPANATNANVSWSSDHTNVATVSSTGAVNPVAVGTATITVTTADGAKTATCTVTVVAATVAVTGVTLDKQTLNLTAGGAEGQLAATIQPANATNSNVTWSSDHPEVATVSSTGAVHPVAAGTATITVTTEDGAKTATCTVTVVAATVAATGVTLDKGTLNLSVGGAVGQLAATVQPANATNTSVSWSSDHPEVATVSPTGAVTPVAAGTATITVTTVDGSFTATCALTVHANLSSLALGTPIVTGQVVVTWAEPDDASAAGATGVEVALTADGSVVQTKTVALGIKTATLVSCKPAGTTFTVSLQLTGSSSVSYAAVTIDGTIAKAEWLVRNLFNDWWDGGGVYYIVSTNGTGTQPTFDCVVGKRGAPLNYRWILVPGLADPTDPTLVSLKNEQYNTTTSQWEESGRYLRIRSATASLGFENYGQYESNIENFCDHTLNNHIAYADLVDAANPSTFNSDATFKMAAGSQANSYVFQWYPEPTRSLREGCIHVSAQLGSSNEHLFFLDPVSAMTP